MPKVNEVYKVKIENLEHGGRGVAHIENIPVFVSNALDGEVTDVKIKKSKKSYAEGDVLKYYEKSKDRIEPICPYAKDCGGCDLMHMSYERELLFKEEKVKEILYKFAKVDSSLIQPILSCDNVSFYRNKATFKVENKIGFYRKKTNQIIGIDRCENVHPLINKLLTFIDESIVLQNVYEIVIRASSFYEETMVVLKVNGPINEEYFIRCFENSVTTLIIFQDNRYFTLLGNGHIREKIGDKTYVISADSFFQINTDGAKMIYDKVLSYLDAKEEDTVLDLYCGTGTIGIYVSDYVKEVYGIEKNRYAILDAYKNKKINNASSVYFECKSASLLTMQDKTSKVVVDPPRAGLDPNTISFLLTSLPERIVYVSCDPVSLARDLSLLKEKYDILEVTPINMFPRTQHVECVCSLLKKYENKFF